MDILRRFPPRPVPGSSSWESGFLTVAMIALLFSVAEGPAFGTTCETPCPSPGCDKYNQPTYCSVTCGEGCGCGSICWHDCKCSGFCSCGSGGSSSSGSVQDLAYNAGMRLDDAPVGAVMSAYSTKTGLTIRIKPGEPLTLADTPITGEWLGNAEQIFDDALESVGLVKEQVNGWTWEVRAIE